MLLCDTHADTLTAISINRNSNPNITLKKSQKGNVNLHFFALWSGPDVQKEKVNKRISLQYKAVEDLIKCGWIQLFDIGKLTSDMTAFILSTEGGEIFHDGLDTVNFWFNKGVRMAGITWNNENKLGFPAKLNCNRGLTSYGFAAVKQMQKLGIAVDVSHLNVRGFLDIFLKTNKPPIASHSCCNSLMPHFRNLTDEQIKLLIRNGGYIGVTFYPDFLSDHHSTIDSVLNHIDHICDLGGENNVGFGSDFDGMDKYPQNLRDSSNFKDLVARMSLKNFSKELIEKISGYNLLRYYERIAT